MLYKFITILIFFPLLLSACAGVEQGSTGGSLRVLAVESFLADMAQNVADDRLHVETLVPLGMDPHAFEPTPRDAATLAETDVLIINGAGFEEWLAGVLENAGGSAQVIEASAGLESRVPSADESAAEEHSAGDPHFWLDPQMAAAYVENIRDGLSTADPAGADAYAQNAAAYIEQLTELNTWIQAQVEPLTPAQRLIVTNHESFGYFADRYGFTILGAVIPSVTSSASPSAQQMAALVDRIRASGAQVIFLETGANPDMADTIAAETGVTVITDLYTHSLSAPGGPAPTYIDMMRHNVNAIVAALTKANP